MCTWRGAGSSEVKDDNELRLYLGDVWVLIKFTWLTFVFLFLQPWHIHELRRLTRDLDSDLNWMGWFTWIWIGFNFAVHVR